MIQIIKFKKDKVYFTHRKKVLSMTFENLLYDLKDFNNKDMSYFTETTTESFWTDDYGTGGKKQYVEITELILPEDMDNKMLKTLIEMDIQKNQTWWHGAKDATNSLVNVVYLLNELAKKHDIKIKVKKIEGRLDVSAELFDDFSILVNHKNKTKYFTIENSCLVSNEFTGFLNAKELVNFIESQLKFRKKR